MKHPVDIDVVVVNYNAGDDIVSMFESLNNDPKLHVQVVDNASVDGSVSALKNKGCSVIENDSNTGFAAACNQGAAVGQNDFIAFVNPDCVLNSTDLQQMVGCFSQNDVGLVGCHVVNMDGSEQRGTWRRLPTFWRVLLTFSRLEKLPGVTGLNLSKPPSTYSAVNGACYIVRRSAFDAVSGFDVGYPLHFEDLDLFARLLANGHRIFCAHQVKVKHIKGLTSKDSAQIMAWKKQGLFRYFKKHRPSWESLFIGFLTGLK